MNRNFITRRPAARLALTLLSLLPFVPTAPARQSDGGAPPPSPAPAQNDEKAERILKRAVEAAGGAAFLGVRTVVARGYYTRFKDGVSLPPARFTDYLAFPDRNRTEFRSGNLRSVHTFAGGRGWSYDNTRPSIVDAGPAQLNEFKLASRTSLDNVLRAWWRGEGAKLSYAGRREAGLARRSEAVRLTYPDGFAVEFEFLAKEGLPHKTRYKRLTEEGDEAEEEERFAQHLTVCGVTLPFVVYHFRAGAQTSRVNYETVEFNAPLADSLFERPADVKSLLKTLR